MGSEDDSTQLVQRLVIKLLKGCSNTFTKNITEDVSKYFYFQQIYIWFVYLNGQPGKLSLEKRVSHIFWDLAQIQEQINALLLRDW